MQNSFYTISYKEIETSFGVHLLPIEKFTAFYLREENSLHWVPDVAFGEVQSRMHRKNADQNMATIRKRALNVIKPDKDEKGRVKGNGSAPDATVNTSNISSATSGI